MPASVFLRHVQAKEIFSLSSTGVLFRLRAVNQSPYICDGNSQTGQIPDGVCFGLNQRLPNMSTIHSTKEDSSHG
jgi:hypothetical protein